MLLTDETLKVCNAASASTAQVTMLDLNHELTPIIAAKIQAAKLGGYTTVGVSLDYFGHNHALRSCDIHAAFNGRFVRQDNRPFFYFVNPYHQNSDGLTDFFERVKKGNLGRVKLDKILIFKLSDYI